MKARYSIRLLSGVSLGSVLVGAGYPLKLDDQDTLTKASIQKPHYKRATRIRSQAAVPQPGDGIYWVRSSQASADSREGDGVRPLPSPTFVPRSSLQVPAANFAREMPSAAAAESAGEDIWQPFDELEAPAFIAELPVDELAEYAAPPVFPEPAETDSAARLASVLAALDTETRFQPLLAGIDARFLVDVQGLEAIALPLVTRPSAERAPDELAATFAETAPADTSPISVAAIPVDPPPVSLAATPAEPPTLPAAATPADPPPVPVFVEENAHVQVLPQSDLQNASMSPNVSVADARNARADVFVPPPEEANPGPREEPPDDRTPAPDETVLAAATPSSAPAAVAAAQSGTPNLDSTPGQQTFPREDSQPTFGYEDELILQLRVAGTSATETIIAYGTREGVYLPLGELARMLDLPIQISDDGNYASGWFLSEDRTLQVSLREGLVETASDSFSLPEAGYQAFDGEMFLRSDIWSRIFPLEIETDLRSQAIILTTLEPFPFEERMRRRAERERLDMMGNGPEPERWPREETPWALAEVPMVDVELRAVSDTPRGTRGEADFRIAGDFAFLTAQAFLSTSTRDGLTAAIIELGRRDADGDLLGPLGATEFLLGDVANRSMPLGIRGASGRGAVISNQSFDGVSVFDEIDFRGVLPNGYEVELYRNDILLASTRQSVNGQYEFLQIPVDYGLNVFRLVFYGPQGQRREEVRRITVGDGRLSPGEISYSAGVVERNVNLLGVEGPDFRRDARYGDWQAIGEIAYGFNRSVTGIASAAFFEDQGRQRWIATAGVRTGIGGLALRGDIGLSEGGGRAMGFGLGGRIFGGGLRLTHFEYSGPFIDELRGIGSDPLRRATEIDFNTSLSFGDDRSVPITLRGRRMAFQDGRVQTNASMRATVRIPGIIASSNLNFVDFSAPDGGGFSQLLGSFDLATFNRSSTQLRGAVGYRLHPDPAITQVAAEISHAIDDRTVIRGTAAYALENGGAAIGLSAVREFDQFTVALDSRYDFDRGDYAVGLRLNFSFGRDPLRNEFFFARPGMSSSGAVAVRAFHDLDGDRVYGPHDVALPDVVFSSAHHAVTTDADGLARLEELGNGNRAVVQIDPSSLPDIFMAPVSRGVEIVPRAGRFHTTGFPVVALSELEGTVTFREDTTARGVSGLRLQLYDEEGELRDYVRTERGGYFFFERVMPGIYTLVIDPEQAERLNLCIDEAPLIEIGDLGDIYSTELSVTTCE